jgi:Family of unknown function (DUF6516)
MRTIDEYLASIRQLFHVIAEAHADRYEEQVLSDTRGNLRIRLRFSDESLLEISEAILIVGEEPLWLSYRYHYQNPHGEVVFRYDNAPHHSEVASYPEHKHARDNIVASSRPSIETVLEEVQAFRVTSERKN